MREGKQKAVEKERMNGERRGRGQKEEKEGSRR